MDPVTIAGIVLGTAAKIHGTRETARAEEEAARYNAAVARQNAILATQQAAEEERVSRVQGRKAVGQVRANYGASGVTLEGSPQDVIEESAANAELDALTIRHRGVLRAMGFSREADLADFRAKNARRAADNATVATLLQGGTELYRLKRTG